MTKYSSLRASEFWSKRLKSADPLAAVLTYNAPKALNESYDYWEKESLKVALPRSLKGKAGLDIGSGIGRITLSLARLGAEVSAVDISRDMLDYLQRAARKEKLGKRIYLVKSSSAELPYKEKSFEIVTCFGLLEHLPEVVRRQTMHETFRVIKPNGKIYLVVNNVDCVFLKKNYPMKSQREDGYFVTLVGLKWMEQVCRESRMRLKIIAANPMYALNHYFVSPGWKTYLGNEQNFAGFCINSTRYDLQASLDNPGLNRFASHFMVRISATR